MKKLIAITAVVALLLTMAVSTPVAAQTERHVGPGQTYATIQAAVDAADSGDTIIVHEGTYEENVEVHVRDLTIEAADDEDMPVVNGDTGEAFLITANDVTVEGFEASSTGKCVIKVDSVDNAVISDNEVTGGNDTNAGIALARANDCEVTGNEVSGPSKYGIRLRVSTGNLIQGNNVSNSDESGITLADGANENDVIGNEVYDCVQDGIRAEESTGNLIEGNEVSDGEKGIVLDFADDNEVIDNEVSGPSENGIMVKASTGNLIEGNEVVSESGQGIALHENASDNRVIGNCVSAYNNTGIDVIDGSHDNLIRGNEVTDSEIGIELVDAHDNRVIGNEVFDSWETGIALADGANGNELIENEVSGSEEEGIAVNDSRHNLIRGNEVSNSGWLDLYDSSAPPPLANTWQDNEYETANF